MVDHTGTRVVWIKEAEGLEKCWEIQIGAVIRGVWDKEAVGRDLGYSGEGDPG